MINTLLFRAKHFVHFLLSAKGAHSLHSPFVFRLYNEVIVPASKSLMSEIENKRKEFRKNHLLIDVMDIKNELSERKPISSIAKSSLSQPKFSSFLRLLLQYIGANTVLETGTSLGINSMYMSAAISVNKVITIEGSPIIAEFAKKLFQKNKNKTIELIQGSIYEKFVPALIQHSPEVIFLDADHRSEAIDFYLNSIKTHTTNVKCIIIHDIYWSKDMFEKWNEIVSDTQYKLTIDIFHAGIIFPNQEMPKQHFKLKF